MIDPTKFTSSFPRSQSSVPQQGTRSIVPILIAQLPTQPARREGAKKPEVVVRLLEVVANQCEVFERRDHIGGAQPH